MSNFVRSRDATAWSRMAGIVGFVGVLVLATAVGSGAIATNEELDTTIEQQHGGARYGSSVGSGDLGKTQE